MKSFLPAISILFILCILILQSTIPLTADSLYIPISSLEDTTLTTILSQINETLLRKYLDPLVGFGPRMTGTYGCDQAAAFIFEQFSSFGLTTSYQRWTSFGNQYNPRIYTSQNVIGTLPGTSTENILIFGAHYDSVKVSPGANDDGSGTAAVLAAADVLSRYQFNHTITFIAFSGEEIGLRGSWEYAKKAFERKDRIIFDFNADMIGFAVTGTGGRRMGFSITEDASWILQIMNNISNLTKLSFELNENQIDRKGRGYSDYFPFVSYGYEAVACWGGGDRDPNMHTENDNLDNINFSFLANTTRIITGTLATLADNEDLPSQIQITSPERQSVYIEGMRKGAHKKLSTLVIDDIWIWAEDQIGATQPSTVEFYYDDHLEYVDTTPPFKWHLNKRSIGTHQITVKSYNIKGQSSTDFLDITYFNPTLS